jgi:hypothetical protein
MSKKPISWIELIKVKLNEEKSQGKSPSINDIMPTAKKDWAQIKAGTHPKYIQGKAQTYARKKKSGDSNKTTRKSKKHESGSSGSSGPDIHEILAQVKMCGKCKKKVEKILSKGKKNMTGGYNQFYDVPSVGNSDGTLTSGNSIPGNALPVPFPADKGPVGYDVNMPMHAQYGGKGKKGSKKQKGGGICGPSCAGGAGPGIPAA